MTESESTIEASGKCNGVGYDKESGMIAVSYDEPESIDELYKKDTNSVNTKYDSNDQITNDLFKAPFHVRFGKVKTDMWLYLSDLKNDHLHPARRQIVSNDVKQREHANYTRHL